MDSRIPSWIRQALQKNPSPYKLWVCLAQGSPSWQGFLLVLFVHEEEAEVIDLWVKEDVRRKGIGEALLQRFEGELEPGCRVFLEVSTQNQPALELYKKQCWTFEYLRKNYYADGSDAQVLQKLPCLGQKS